MLLLRQLESAKYIRILVSAAAWPVAGHQAVTNQIGASPTWNLKLFSD